MIQLMVKLMSALGLSVVWPQIFQKSYGVPQTECCLTERANPGALRIFWFGHSQIESWRSAQNIVSQHLQPRNISICVLTLNNLLSVNGTVEPQTWKVILIESLFNSFSLGITVFFCRERRQWWEVRGSEWKWWLIKANMCPLMSQCSVIILFNEPRQMNDDPALVFRSDS